MWNKLFSEKKQLLGYSLKTSSALLFFGTRHLLKSDLSDYFPQYTFCFLKQVHSNVVVEANEGTMIEADGHWTTQKGLAVAIQTADCMPVLIASDSKVAAVHAGWRGLEAGIIKTAASYFPTSSTVLLGPHIHRESFEVGMDVATLLQKCAPDQTLIGPHPQPDKSYVDLSAAAKAHIHSNFKVELYEELRLNTFTHPDFASYRSSGGTIERQYSFAVLL